MQKILMSFILSWFILWVPPSFARAIISEVQISDSDKVRLGAILSFLEDFYAARGNTPAWTDTEDVHTALELIALSSEDGLDPEDFAMTRLQVLAAAGHSRDLDIQLTANIALLGYVLENGKTEPQDLVIEGFWDRVRTGDPAFDLNYAIEADALPFVFSRLGPQNDYYRNLKSALADYRAVAAAGGWSTISEGPVLRLGDQGPRVKELAERLIAGGYMKAVDEQGSGFGAAHDGAVRAFQRDHGEEPDGIVGPRTLAAMNVTVRERIDQIRVNLERARWIGNLPEDRHIIVNIAGFYAAVMEGAEPTWTTRVIVGEEFTQTPVFLDEMEYIEMNPTWTAPRSITRNELAPKIIADPSYLQRNDYYLAEGSGRRVDTGSVDFSRLSAQDFPYWIVQEPGDKNALGRIKFMFPNSYSVYMHDTPGRHLFDKTLRTFSHGCIRTENPLDLAALLLAEQGWDRAQINEIVESGKRTRVTLDQRVPVAILYWTADPTADGIVFHPDIYGRDASVLEALNAPLQFEDR